MAHRCSGSRPARGAGAPTHPRIIRCTSSTESRRSTTRPNSPIRWSFAEAVHRQTEGNPLFVQEVLRYLVEEGLVVRKEGRWEGRWRETGEAPPEMSIPEGLRDVVGKRLSRLSDRANQVLSVAAVIGRDFRLDVLQRGGRPFPSIRLRAGSGLRTGPHRGRCSRVAQRGDGARHPEERSALGVLAFRFTHAFFRQTLYEEIFAAQRLKLHQQVARGLEAAYARRLEEHASELAEHYSQSTDPADLQNALDYSELAAKRAMSVFAYVEAARHLEQALKLQDVLDPDDHAKRCDLLLALGEARMPLGEPRWVADEVAPQAYAVAETLADHARASRACQMALEALHRDNTGIATGTPEFKEWAERADRYAEPGTTDRAYTDIALGRVHIARRARAAGVGLLRGALALARELDDPELLFTAVWQCLRNMPSPRHWREAVALAEEFIDRSRAGVKNRTQGQLLEFCGVALMYNGDRDRAEAAFLELSEVADKTRDASNQLQALSFRGAMAVIDGRLEDALDLGQQLIDQAHLLGTPGGAGIVLRGRGRPLIYLEKLGPGDESGGLPAMRPLFLAYMGRHREAAELLERTLPLYTTERGAIDNLAYTSDLESLLEAATVLGNTQVVEQVAPLFADCPGVASPHGVPASTQRLVAAAYALMGEPERAREHYERAIETCTTMRFRPELALSRLALAELLLDEAISLQPSAVSHPQSKLKADQLRAEGSDHLDFAIKEFEAMKMAPSLERALALRLRVHG